MHNNIIFFDLDGTLTPDNTWHLFNTYFGMTQAEDQMMLNWYSRSIISYHTWDELIVAILREQKKCHQSALNDFFNTITIPQETIDTIQACKDKGYTPIILSGTLKQIADNVGQRIGIDVIHTTSCAIFDTNGMLESIDNEKDEGPAKQRIFIKLSEQYGVDPKKVLYVGDSRNDLEIFQTTQYGVLIGTKDVLKPFAWKEIQNIEEVLPLLS